MFAWFSLHYKRSVEVVCHVSRRCDCDVGFRIIEPELFAWIRDYAARRTREDVEDLRRKAPHLVLTRQHVCRYRAAKAPSCVIEVVRVAFDHANRVKRDSFGGATES